MLYAFNLLCNSIDLRDHIVFIVILSLCFRLCFLLCNFAALFRLVMMFLCLLNHLDTFLFRFLLAFRFRGCFRERRGFIVLLLLFLLLLFLLIFLFFRTIVCIELLTQINIFLFFLLFASLIFITHESRGWINGRIAVNHIGSIFPWRFR